MPLNISKIDFVLMYIIGNRGTGKTLFSANYAFEYRNKFPDNIIYSNFKLNLSNAIYSPFMFLNYSEIDNALIIIDDIRGIKNFENFIFIITNWSRKSKLHILLTGQYYTHFKKESRTLAEYEVHTLYKKERDILFVAFVDNNHNVHYQQIPDAVKRGKKIYNTYEKVPIPTQTRLIELVKETSKNMDDLEINLSLYFAKRKTYTLLAKIGRELGFVA